MSYGPQSGHPVWPPAPPPGHAPYRSPGGGVANGMAHACAGLFLACGLLALVTAIVGWNGTTDDVDMLVALVGAAFSGEVTGNLDFAISVTMSVACTTLTFALVLFARLDLARWVLGVVGALVTVYYAYAIVDLLADGGGEFVAMPVVSLLLWAVATAAVLLPHTGRAMRGHQRGLGRAGWYGYPPRPPSAGHRPH